MSSKHLLRTGLIAASLFAAVPVAFAADGEPWLVSKSSGEVWVTSKGASQVSLGRDEELKPGDTIRTGPAGRVRLTRGEEVIVIAPNSEVGLPAAPKDGMATTILQRAGSILLDVEKRNVQHFEVETPYLAAVVKGTQFTVTVSGRSTKVEVSRGQVQVSDFKTGQIAQIMPGQAAATFNGASGLKLSGAGTFSPIEQGRPRAPTIDRIPVPRDGLQAPREAKGSVIHALNANSTVPRAATSAAAQQPSATTSHGGARPNVVRISTSLGEVNLNIQKATRGLAHGAHGAPGAGRSNWSEARGGNGNATSNAAAASGASGDSSVAAAISAAIGSPAASAGNNGSNGAAVAAAANGNGNGNGNGAGNGNNGGNGNSGHGNSGHGNSGNSGNSGRGNSGDDDHGGGRGRGHAYGHNKD
ncbi:FecR domain-containing protein [Bradyrhizobium sp. HKCCYLRH3099]|uniref:FecR domain-containing protein n=1 Tax=unclassified Bradyrhizobium TaxID=2631580 RepID=UPI003EBD408F